MIKLTILGNNSAIPAHGRHPSAQIVEIREQLFLVDCGEGTQLQIQQYNIKRRRINYIFISHLHGDHYFGLIGLITSMGLLGRAQPLYLFGPPLLEEIINLHLSAAFIELPYEIIFRAIEHDAAGILIDAPHYQVSCFPVMHRIPCHGFLFTAKSSGRKLIPEKCREFQIPSSFYQKLKEGQDYIRRDGFLVHNDWVTEPGPTDRKYAYCADTLYTESFLPYINGADAIYHESTYLQADTQKAFERYHSTAGQAAQIALKANAQKLFLGHFSSKYVELDPFREEASLLFPNTEVTVEGITYEI